MPRNARVDVGEEIYHVINRANGRLQIFSKDEDYKLFEQILLETKVFRMEEIRGLKRWHLNIVWNQH